MSPRVPREEFRGTSSINTNIALSPVSSRLVLINGKHDFFQGQDTLRRQEKFSHVGSLQKPILSCDRSKWQENGCFCNDNFFDGHFRKGKGNVFNTGTLVYKPLGFRERI